MDGEAGWWTTSGNIGLPPLARVMGVGRQQQGIDVQQMVIAALASLQRISSDVNGLSVAIDNVNMRQAHFESILKAGGRIAEPKVECGELNTKQMAMASNKMSDGGSQTDKLGDSEGFCQEANLSIQI